MKLQSDQEDLIKIYEHDLEAALNHLYDMIIQAASDKDVHMQAFRVATRHQKLKEARNDKS